MKCVAWQDCSHRSYELLLFCTPYLSSADFFSFAYFVLFLYFSLLQNIRTAVQSVIFANKTVQWSGSAFAVPSICWGGSHSNKTHRNNDRSQAGWHKSCLQACTRLSWLDWSTAGEYYYLHQAFGHVFWAWKQFVKVTSVLFNAEYVSFEPC